MKLQDSSIGHIAKILQMAILAGTDIVDHLRMVRFEVDDDQTLKLNEEYEKVFNESIEQMMSNASQQEEKQD